MNKKRRISIFLVLLAIISLVILSFAFKTSDKDSKVTQQEFTQFTNELFVDFVTSDSISLNYTLMDPKSYEIESFEPTLGDFSLDYLKKSIAKSENELARLKKFHYKSLTDSQKLTYDILKSSLTADIESGDYILYMEALSPTIGIQAQLPVLFAEYNFYTKESIEEYLNLLPKTYDYFQQIIDFEKEKSAAGLFMSDFAVNDIVSQCEKFISNTENNYLITIFNDKIDNYPGLSSDEITNFKDTNKEVILTYVIPAYELLIKELEALKGTGKNDGGLCNFPDGKKYYEHIVREETGSNKSIEDLTALLEENINADIAEITSLAVFNNNIYNESLAVSYPLTDPEEIIASLKEKIKKDYPDLEEVECTIKYVHKSLEEDLSPAFYLSPAIDNWKENSIYINRNKKFDMSKIFTTLAHEGYPGHLYQMVYFNQQNPAAIRAALNFGGYSEGWATYVEYDSYSMIGINDKVASFLKHNGSVSLYLSARIDIGINYEGWDREKTYNYVKTYFGIDDTDAIDDIYNSIVEEPANYLKYAIGYLEFKNLREKAEKALDDKFSAKSYHEFILKTGPAPFYIIDKRLDKWIKTQK